MKKSASTGALNEMESNVKGCSLVELDLASTDRNSILQNWNRSSQTMIYFDMCASLIQALART